MLQHLCGFHGKRILINRIVWHGTSEQGHKPSVYPCKSSKTPNKLRTNVLHRICSTETLPSIAPPPPPGMSRVEWRTTRTQSRSQNRWGRLYFSAGAGG